MPGRCDALSSHPPEAPAPLRFSRADYRRMAQAGLFEGRRVELLEGEVVLPNGRAVTAAALLPPA